MTDTLMWTQDIDRGASLPQLSLKLNTDFRTQNIFLKVQYTGPGLDEPREVLIEENLITSEGEWLAPISGNTVSWDGTSRPQLEVPQSGTYSFKLYHFMREEDLCAVKEVNVYSN